MPLYSQKRRGNGVLCFHNSIPGVIGQLCDTHNMIHLKTPNKFSEPSGCIDKEYTIINCIDISHSVYMYIHIMKTCTSNSWMFVVGRRFGILPMFDPQRSACVAIFDRNCVAVILLMEGVEVGTFSHYLQGFCTFHMVLQGFFHQQYVEKTMQIKP